MRLRHRDCIKKRIIVAAVLASLVLFAVFRPRPSFWYRNLIPQGASNVRLEVEDDGRVLRVVASMSVNPEIASEFATQLLKEWPDLMEWETSDYNIKDFEGFIRIGDDEGGFPQPPRNASIHENVVEIKNGYFYGSVFSFHPGVWIDVENRRMYVFSSD